MNVFARDERQAGLDRAGDRLGYLVLSYGLLLVVAYRSLVDRQASWELLGLVILGGAVSAGYRAWHRSFTREAGLLAGLTILVAVAVAVLVAFIGR